MSEATLQVRPRPAGFLRDMLTIAGRALRAASREPDVLFVSLIVPPFFFAVNVGALERTAAFVGIDDFRAFQLPVAVLFAVTGVSRAVALVTDITSGYFDRLLASPVNRAALLLGLMASDFVVVIALTALVMLMGLIVGVELATGLVGAAGFLLLGGLWGLAFTGFPYAIALRTGSPTAVNLIFLLFLPLVFLTTAFAPKEALSGWMSTAADFNPVTYVLAGLRDLIGTGWTREVLRAVAAIGGVGGVSFGLALLALRGRVRRG